MNKTNVFDLLQGSFVMTTGVVEFVKPRYDRFKFGKTYRIGYQIAIRTPHTVTTRGATLPIFVSIIGKSSSWHAYHILMRTKAPISISGIREVTKVYENKKKKNKRTIWVILKKEPVPTMVYMGENLYSLID